MKNEKLSNILGELDQSIIAEAACYKKRKRRHILLKRGSITAACLSTVLLIVLLLSFAIGNDSSERMPKQTTAETSVMESGVLTLRQPPISLDSTVFVIAPTPDITHEETVSEASGQLLKLYNTNLIAAPSKIGEALYDYTLGNLRTTDFKDCEAFTVDGMPSDSVIAVLIEEEYIIFATEEGCKLLTLEDFTVSDGKL